MNYVKQLDRRELVLAVWAAEFARCINSTPTMRPAVRQGPPSAATLREIAEWAARSADSTVEALRLLIDVEFRLANTNDLDDCYMTWDAFVATCRSGGFTDDDGHGELATADQQISNVRVYPCDARDKNYARPDWATHVCWYNK